MAFFQLLCEPVDTFSAAEMQFFPLPQVPGGRAYFREIAVHVPFDVVDGVLGEQVVQNLDEISHHLGICHIELILIAAHEDLPVGIGEHPFRMF